MVVAFLLAGAFRPTARCRIDEGAGTSVRRKDVYAGLETAAGPDGPPSSDRLPRSVEERAAAIRADAGLGSPLVLRLFLSIVFIGRLCGPASV